MCVCVCECEYERGNMCEGESVCERGDVGVKKREEIVASAAFYYFIYTTEEGSCIVWRGRR